MNVNVGAGTPDLAPDRTEGLLTDQLASDHSANGSWQFVGRFHGNLRTIITKGPWTPTCRPREWLVPSVTDSMPTSPRFPTT